MKRRNKRAPKPCGKIIAKMQAIPRIVPVIYREGDEELLKNDFRNINDYRGPLAAIEFFKFRGNILPKYLEDVIG